MVEQLDTEVVRRLPRRRRRDGAPRSRRCRRDMFSPPLDTRTWFHQGPVGDGDGDWQELDWSDGVLAGRSAGARAPAGHRSAFLRRLPRRAPARRAAHPARLRPAHRALRARRQRARGAALHRHRERCTACARRSVPARATTSASRIFFPHQLAQRTTQWERGDDPMTQFAFTDDYDQYGQPGSLSSIAVPRGRNYRIAGAPGDPYLATHTANTYAHRDDAQRYMGDRVVRLSSYEIPNDGSSSLSALHAGIVDGSASRRLIAQQLEFYDGEAFVGLPFGQIGEHGIVTRTESLAVSEAMLQDAYRSDAVAQASPERPSYLVPDGASWAAEYPQEFRSLLSPLAGYVFQSGDPGSPYERGYFIATTRRRYDCQDEAAVRPRGLLVGTRDPLGCDTTIAYDDFALLPVEITRASGLTRRGRLRLSPVAAARDRRSQRQSLARHVHTAGPPGCHGRHGEAGRGRRRHAGLPEPSPDLRLARLHRARPAGIGADDPPGASCGRNRRAAAATRRHHRDGGIHRRLRATAADSHPGG